MTAGPNGEGTLRCPHCAGRLEERTIRHAVIDGDRVVVFTEVPAMVCVQCGEPVFAGAVVDRMNEFVWSLPGNPSKEVSVHFHSLAVEVGVA